MKSFVPPNTAFTLLAITACCLTEQWFSIDNITGYLEKEKQQQSW
jgi:hypothetical protein